MKVCNFTFIQIRLCSAVYSAVVSAWESSIAMRGGSCVVTSLKSNKKMFT